MGMVLAQVSVARICFLIFVTTTLIGLGVLAASSNLRWPEQINTTITEYQNGTQGFVKIGGFSPVSFSQSVGLWVIYLAFIFLLGYVILKSDCD